MRLSRVPRRWLVRGIVLVVVLALLAPAVASAVTYRSSDSDLRAGTIDRAPDGLTVVAVQGFHFEGKGSVKKPARLVAFGPRGDVRWVYNGSNVGARWFYDVDPLPSGNLLVTATNPDGTIVMSLDPRTREPVWTERLPIHDTHDVDMLDEHRLVVANMRAYNESSERNDDRLFVYNRTSGATEWEWHFRDHYPADGGGKYTDDWTHVNDVDPLGDGRFLVSPRNFDQVIVVNRNTGEIELRLGSDDDRDVLYEQHNPQYLESDDGRPTILVADSENSRVVEYEKRGDEWERTWDLSGSFSWPRDADRLPNGNTLVVDSLNHRVIEVTPEGRIVWEVYAPWGPYDAERIRLGDEPGGPTIRDQGAAGSYTVSGSAGLEPGTGDRVTFAQRLKTAFVGTPLEGPAKEFANRWAHVTPWIYPVWMTGWDFAGAVAAALVLLGWGLVELVLRRDAVVRRFRRTAP